MNKLTKRISIIFSLVFMIILSSTEVSAAKIPTKTIAKCSDKMSSTLYNKGLSVKCNGANLECTFYRSMKKYTILKLEIIQQYSIVKEQEGKFDKYGKAKISIDLAEIKDAVYDVIIYQGYGYTENDENGYITSEHYTSSGGAEFCIKLSNGVVKVYSPAGKSEEDFIKYVSSKYKKPKNIKIPWYLESALKNKDIKTKTKKIIAGCRNDKEKVKAINDWLAENIYYDYESLIKNNIYNAADPIKVFKTRHAVCSGYSRLARIMFYHAGIPCLNVTGYAGTIKPNKLYKKIRSNHEWNLVYVNKKWHILDTTWDSNNEYFGKGNKENVSGKPNHTYYGINPIQFGVNHVSMTVQ